MRDGWIGDVADFAKYGLLRRLSSALRLGVIWYRTTHAGLPIEVEDCYLEEKRPNQYSHCDVALLEHFDRMRAERTVCTLEDVARYGLLPPGTIFYTSSVSGHELPADKREFARMMWFDNALSSTSDREILFLDPDTGITSDPAVGWTDPDLAEYAFMSEISALLDRGQSVVVVQFGRPGRLESEPFLARERLGQLALSVRDACSGPWGLWWGEGYKVGLLVAAAPTHAERLWQWRLEILGHPGWSQLVTPLDLPR